MSASLLIAAVRMNPEMFASTSNILTTSRTIEEHLMPYLVNRPRQIGFFGAMDHRYHRLKLAVRRDNVARVKELLAYGADPRLGNRNVLMELVIDTNGCYGVDKAKTSAIMKALLEADPELPAIPSKGGLTAMHMILGASNGYQESWEATKIEMMIEACPRALEKKDDKGKTPMDYARFKQSWIPYLTRKVIGL